MRNITLRKSGILGVLLALMLVIFSTSLLSFTSTYANSPAQIEQSVDADSHELSSEHASIHGESRAPAKSLAPNLAQLLRNGSLLPERIDNIEPNYELVIELANTLPTSFQPSFSISLCHWHDWTRSPPRSSYRLAGWKDANLLYRFISQSHA